MTGHMCFVAIRHASMIVQKQSDGELGAITQTGLSEFRPYIAWRRSACSVFVGSPVDGPPRCTSTITSGSSVMTASPTASALSATPGPDVPVHARLPAKAAPIADDTAA